MKLITFLLFSILAAISTATAQVELVSGDYFPAELEFRELQKVTLDEKFEDPARLSKVENGRLFSDVGFSRYAKRVYSVGDSGSLSVEVVTLRDFRAAYSLLSLLRTGNMQDGAPGDFFSMTPERILFAQGKEWVRIEGRGAPEDLARRVAISVSNRIGPQRPKPPSLVAHMPKLGYDASSLRYYPGIKAFEAYPGNAGTNHFRLSPDMEIAQAHYSLNNYTGTLSLLSFPTGPVAEEYFAGLTGSESGARTKLYTKRAGPIVGVLEGPFDPRTADKILSSIQYSYSIKWIYEKQQPKVMWGIPAGILGTVVKSLLFVVILAGFSILIGIAVAAFRVLLRKYAPGYSPDSPERTEITRLKLP